MTDLYQHSAESAYILNSDLAENETLNTAYVAHLSTSEILVLKDSAAVIWTFFKDPASIEEVTEDISDLYKVNPESVAEEIRGFIRTLEDKHILTKITNN